MNLSSLSVMLNALKSKLDLFERYTVLILCLVIDLKCGK